MSAPPIAAKRGRASILHRLCVEIHFAKDAREGEAGITLNRNRRVRLHAVASGHRDAVAVNRSPRLLAPVETLTSKP
jgi:hypothetical protein